MELLLVRHAIAAEPRSGRPDRLRPLTTRGRRRMERVVAGLLALDLRCDRLRHSPWLRAAQTAELLAPLVAGPTIACELLAQPPGPALLAAIAAPSAGAARAAMSAADDERVALVGHQPWMGELLALLAFGSERPSERLIFGKGGVAWLIGECRPGGMQLRALFPPRVLRELAGR